MNLGDVTVQVLPDLTEFKRLIESAPGLVVTETVSYVYDGAGRVSTKLTTTRVAQAETE